MRYWLFHCLFLKYGNLQTQFPFDLSLCQYSPKHRHRNWIFSWKSTEFWLFCRDNKSWVSFEYNLWCHPDFCMCGLWEPSSMMGACLFCFSQRSITVTLDSSHALSFMYWTVLVWKTISRKLHRVKMIPKDTRQHRAVEIFTGRKCDI